MMAKLTTHITGKVSNKIVVDRNEIRAMLIQRYPSIPVNADMTCDTDLTNDQSLETIVFEWASDTSEDPHQIDLKPVAAGCGAAKCPERNPVAVAMRPPMVDDQPPEITPGREIW